MKSDGYRCDDSTYLAQWWGRREFHQPDGVDYRLLLKQFDIIRRIDNCDIDKVWDMAFPYSGYWESMMMGPGAIFCNSDPDTLVKSTKPFVYMGFSYERGVGEMLENFGHRAESILKHVYHGWEVNEDNDWANTILVDSYCDDWLRYPELSGSRKKVDCTEWGCEIRSHHKWWFSHFPKAPGKKNGIWNNWWKYVMDYGNAISDSR